MEANDFIKAQVLTLERRSFAFRLLASAIGYAALTFWLNSIRATAALWLVWTLIIIQFALYFSIFIISYRRSVVFGLNKGSALFIFVALTVLSRVDNWELVIIPALVVIMLVLSAVNKKISERGQLLLPKDEGVVR
jgi:hypothetical protein